METTETLVDQSGVRMWQPKNIWDRATDHKKITATIIIVALLFIATLATAITQTIDNNHLSKQVTSLKTDKQNLTDSNNSLSSELTTAQDEASTYKDDASYVEQCRSAGRALATAGTKRNNIFVKILQNPLAAGSFIPEVTASNNEYGAAVAQLKLCDPNLTASDIGL